MLGEEDTVGETEIVASPSCDPLVHEFAPNCSALLHSGGSTCSAPWLFALMEHSQLLQSCSLARVEAPETVIHCLMAV